MSKEASGRFGVIAGGNWIVDHVKIIDSWPPQDSLVNIQSETHANGGAPYNVLKNLSKLGADFPLEAVGLIGKDPNGDVIIDDCRRHGIDTRQLRRTPLAATSYTDVMTVRSTGRRTFFHQRGANAHLAPEHFDFSGTRAKFLHLGYMLLLDELDRLVDGRPQAGEVLRRARAAGLQTSLDVVSENSDRFHTVVHPVLPEVDILFVNDYEAEKLTDICLRKDGVIQRSLVEAAANSLVSHGVRQWVILHSPEVVFAVSTRGEACWQPSLRVPSAAIKGLAGAGDAFASGVLYAQHGGCSMADSMRLGICVAASSLSDSTCSEGVLTAAECLGLIEKWGFQPGAR
jgi:sugar/nucleoside kinase (ribokinase family)